MGGRRVSTGCVFQQENDPPPPVLRAQGQGWLTRGTWSSLHRQCFGFYWEQREQAPPELPDLVSTRRACGLAGPQADLGAGRGLVGVVHGRRKYSRSEQQQTGAFLRLLPICQGSPLFSFSFNPRHSFARPALMIPICR